MKVRLGFVLTILAITLAGFANAQEKKTLSLNEAIDLSIKNSKQFKN